MNLDERLERIINEILLDSNLNTKKELNESNEVIPYEMLNVPVVQNITAIVQTTNNSINKMVEASAPVIHRQRVLELTALLNQCSVQLQKLASDVDSLADEAKEKVNQVIVKIKDQNKKVIDQLNKIYNKSVKILKSSILFVTEVYDLFGQLLNAKLPKDIIQSVAYSNPITAIVADNFDIITNTVTAFTNLRHTQERSS